MTLFWAIAALALVGCGSDDKPVAQEPTEPAKNAAICPEGAAEGKGLSTEKLIGLKLAEAESEAQKFDCTVRPVEVDGEPQVTTMDLRQDRVNVVLENDRITAIKGVY